MNRTVLTILLVAITWSLSFGNREKIGVLEKQLEKASDTTRVNILLELSVLYLRIDSHKADSIAHIALKSANIILLVPSKNRGRTIASLAIRLSKNLGS